MELGNMVATGVRAIVFAALNHFEGLNSLVNRITSGRINRDTLAQNVLGAGVQAGIVSQLPAGRLSDRSAVIGPMVSKIIFDNTSNEMHTSIQSLTQEIFPSSPELKGTLLEKGTQVAQTVAASVASFAADIFLGPQFTENLLATTQREHSFKPLQNYMEQTLAVYLPTGEVALSKLTTNLLDKAIANQPQLNPSHEPYFRLLAAELNEYITGNSDYTKPLAEYSKEALPHALLAAVEGTGKVVVSGLETLSATTITLAEGFAGLDENLAKQDYSAVAWQTGSTLARAAGTAVHGVATNIAPAALETGIKLTGITVAGAVGAVVLLTPTAQSLYRSTLSRVDQTQHALVGPPALKNAADAYAKDILQAKTSPNEALLSLPQPDARISDSQWINALAKQQTIVQAAAPDMLLTSSEHQAKMEQAFQKAPIDSARKDALVDLTDRFSADQIAPFGMLATSLQAAHYLSGNLAKMTSESQAEFALADSTARSMGTAIAATPLKESSKGGYKLADAYAQHVGKLALDFPEGVYSNAEAGLDAAKAASNYTLGSWGYQDVNATDWAELRKLYNSCGGNEQLTIQVSSYLDPAIASQVLAAPVLGELDPKNTGLLQLPTGLQLQLTDATPQYQYQLRRDGENVLLTINAAWDITQYGTDGEQLRSPQGSLPSQLKSSLTITVSPNGTVTHSTPALQCAIRNELNFTTNGALEKYTPVDVKTPEPHLVSGGPVGLSQAAIAVAS